MLAYVCVYMFNELVPLEDVLTMLIYGVSPTRNMFFVAKSLLDLHTYCVLKMILGAVTLKYTTLEVRTSYK